MLHRVMYRSLFLIFEGIRQLREEFPKKDFILDGGIVGDIGAVIAEKDYELVLPDKQLPTHDAVSFNGRLVQIKATFKDSIELRFSPDYLLVFKLYTSGEYEEIYNGPGKYLQEKVGHRLGFNEKQLTISIGTLKEIQPIVSVSEKILHKDLISSKKTGLLKSASEINNKTAIAAKKEEYLKLNKDRLIQLELKKIATRVPHWSEQTNHKAHQVMLVFCKLKKRKEKITISELIEHCSYLANPRSYIAHMSNITPNNYAKVFDIRGGFVEIWPPAKQVLSKYYDI